MAFSEGVRIPLDHPRTQRQSCDARSKARRVPSMEMA
jgi:hypothetical protein